MKLIYLTMVLMIVALSLSGCLQTGEQQSIAESKASTETPIEMIITPEMVSEFCTNNDYAGGYIYANNFKAGRVTWSSSSTNPYYNMHRVCTRPKTITGDFQKTDVETWLVSIGVIAKDEQIQTANDTVYDLFCSQKGYRLNTVRNTTITCIQDVTEEKEFTGQDIAKWFIRKNINRS